MRKDIYLYASDIQLIELFKKDDLFEPTFKYDPKSLEKALPNEVGRIKTHSNYYNIILGLLQQDRCPWCNYNVEPVCTGKSGFMLVNRYCMQCVNCGSRGPMFNVPAAFEIEKEKLDLAMDKIKERYAVRIPVDRYFETKSE